MKEKIKIGGSWYDIEYHKELRNDKNEKVMGFIYFDKKIIQIVNQFPEQTQLQTKFHESTHGIFNEYDMDGDEHDIVTFSNVFYAFIVDNPRLIKKILKCAEENKC